MEPRYAKRTGASKRDPFAQKLSQWLKAEQSKGRKQQRTLLQIHADLVALGFDGSYGRVAAFARAWRQRQHETEKSAGRGTFVPLVFQPGEAFQFDWSEDWAFIGGERVKLQVAHTKLSHSRAFHLRAAAAGCEVWRCFVRLALCQVPAQMRPQVSRPGDDPCA